MNRARRIVFSRERERESSLGSFCETVKNRESCARQSPTGSSFFLLFRERRINLHGLSNETICRRIHGRSPGKRDTRRETINIKLWIRHKLAVRRGLRIQAQPVEFRFD